ncbi:hypothetical protein QEG98_16725 [Myxococcus sp. MxC21-1]|uniref:hypothetical protein n=1 Tax=Myxococcus sp. MxC21-1 TaxID=3041439 RepID=UPI00292E5202|nr:hypothetical protein [Myxococcus sp. MxC21-1]WNZ65125.1 hypothetical protein QEG98_16725 [Myxococcus sp. MxC21-1]
MALKVGDLTEFTADAVLFKYAQSLYGATGQAARRLELAGVPLAQLELAPGATRLVETRGR